MVTATLTNGWRLTEEVAISTPRRVDAKAGIAYGVKVLGAKSKNSRTYTEAAMRDAVPLYSGVKVYFDHSYSNGERGFAEVFGELRNPRYRDGGIYANLHYNRRHALAGTFEEHAERFPKQIGLSHHADGRSMRRDGSEVVEEIRAVRSVDIVSRPATSQGLFEQEGLPDPAEIDGEPIPGSSSVKDLDEWFNNLVGQLAKRDGAGRKIDRLKKAKDRFAREVDSVMDMSEAKESFLESRRRYESVDDIPVPDPHAFMRRIREAAEQDFNPGVYR